MHEDNTHLQTTDHLMRTFWGTKTASAERNFGIQGLTGSLKLHFVFHKYIRSGALNAVIFLGPSWGNKPLVPNKSHLGKN